VAEAFALTETTLCFQNPATFRVMHVAAMGIDTEGRKRILGIVEGGSENSEIVKALLAYLIERGLDASEPQLYILDGGKALHKAVKEVFGKKAVI